MAKIHFLYLDIQTGTYHGVNHGIAVLAAVLKQAGHRVSLHHLTGEVNPREVLKQIADIQPHLAAFSCTTNQYGFLEKYAKAIKERFNIPILVGGIHASLCPEEVIANPYVDMVCIGEGEYALRELAIRIDKAHDFTGIANLWIKNSAKAIIKDKVGLQVKNLDELPLPDYELFDMQRILRETNATLYLMGSRGCPFDCNYCCNQALSSIYGSSRYLRSYSVNYLLDMIEQLKHKFNPRQLFFEDDTFSLNKKWCLDFCRQYKAKLGLSFGANIRLDTISEELISALKDAGCNRLNFGIESGNEWLRKNILNRNISNQEIIERVGLIKKHHIKTYSYNMMGLPFETQEMIRDTITLNQQVEIDSGDVFFFYPFPK
ncbi:MAG: B12-binding domain-containing radical SAM protein, partial [Candidatus Omnitrophota bacterium]